MSNQFIHISEYRIMLSFIKFASFRTVNFATRWTDFKIVLNNSKWYNNLKLVIAQMLSYNSAIVGFDLLTIPRKCQISDSTDFFLPINVIDNDAKFLLKLTSQLTFWLHCDEFSFKPWHKHFSSIMKKSQISRVSISSKIRAFVPHIWSFKNAFKTSWVIANKLLRSFSTFQYFCMF